MPLRRVSFGFTELTDTGLDDFCEGVTLKLYGNASYPVPPVAAADLITARNQYSAALAAANLGGPAQTAEKNNKRDVLTTLLRQLGLYVQELHGNDLAVLLSSGFFAVSTNRASSPLPAPAIKKIRPGNTSGAMIVCITPVKNARAYELRWSLLAADGQPGPWQTASIPFTDSRALLAGGLTPGAEYKFQARALGGSTGASDWSDAVTKRAM